MLISSLVLLDLSPAFTRLGTLPYNKAPRYFQQANAKKSVMTSAQLLVASTARQNNSTSIPAGDNIDMLQGNIYPKEIEVTPQAIGLFLGECSSDNGNAINQYQEQKMLPFRSSLTDDDDTIDNGVKSIMEIKGESPALNVIPDGSRMSRPRFQGNTTSNPNNAILNEYAISTSPSTSYGSKHVIDLLRNFNAEEDAKFEVHKEEERKWKMYKQHHENDILRVRRNSFGIDRNTGARLPSVRNNAYYENNVGEGKNISHHQYPLVPLPLHMEDYYHATRIKKSLDTSGLIESNMEDHAPLRPLLRQSPNTSKGPRTALLSPEADYDDDVVIDDQTTELLNTKSLQSNISLTLSSQSDLAVRQESTLKLTNDKHQESDKISIDIIDMVTDEYAKQRESEIRRRRKILYELTHPIPTDYTFNGKLIPPPPIAFGKVPEESMALGEKMMLNQNYRLVRTSPHTDYFFEINDLYIEIAMVGKANAGKSSLINALLGNNVAKTSSTPNSTRGVNFYQSVTPDELQRFVNRNPSRLVKLPAGGAQLTFVDLPGFGIAGMSDKWRENAIAVTDGYLGVRRSLNTIFMCIDATKGLTAIDRRYFSWIENLHGVFYIVLTKCEAVSHDKLSRIIRHIYQVITDTNKGEKKYKAVYPYVIPVSAHTGENIDMLRGIIVETSGLVPGQKLRKMLRRKVEEANRLTEGEEILRIEAARKIEREIAEAEYEKKLSLQLEDSRVLSKTMPSSPLLSSVLPPKSLPPMTFNNSLSTSHVPEKMNTVQTEASNVHLNVEKLKSALGSEMLARKGKIASLNYRGDKENENNENNNYQGYIKKFNLGLMDLPDSIVFGDEDSVSDTSQKTDEAISGSSENRRNLPLSVRLSSSSSVIGVDMGAKFARNPEEKGMERPITQYLSSLEKFSENKVNKCEPVPKWMEKKQQRWEQNMKSVRYSPLLVQNPKHPDILQPMKAGKVAGPKLVVNHRHTNGKVKVAVNALNAENLTTYRLMKEAMSISPTAPWAASSQTCKRKQEELKKRFGIRMSKQEISQYMKYSGKTLQTFEEFDNEVTVKKFMQDKRVANSTYHSCLARVSDENRISYGQQPIGMLKKYGRRKSYRKTDSVKGV
eukprot:Tbor_TRINITY_DN5592_c3_g4::TRINITY_DN5592_c3_g4_i1::g.13589::m.13589